MLSPLGPTSLIIIDGLEFIQGLCIFLVIISYQLCSCCFPSGFNIDTKIDSIEYYFESTIEKYWGVQAQAAKGRMALQKISGLLFRDVGSLFLKTLILYGIINCPKILEYSAENIFCTSNIFYLIIFFNI